MHYENPYKYYKGVYFGQWCDALIYEHKQFVCTGGDFGYN